MNICTVETLSHLSIDSHTHTHTDRQTELSAWDVMFILVGNCVLSSNPGRDCLHFTLL